ncbi:mitochondrial import inner membrane translocase subunit TIM23-3 [Cornus florida]|uniref:mitochondrial import inner membrane translocase subunit TIM23-3 n=1 Tax=Cornus florida TaxID=4283 RepID=UPI0028978289|nr:mitochondrial import inner membrane translocase subunit TIM23-3 [Cornus florida]
MASDSSSEKKPKSYRQYHPYQDFNVPIQNLYNLPSSPEYLFSEEAAVQRRSWSENLTYYTGSGYLAGAIVGAAKGTLQGFKEAEAGETLKLRVNRVLNTGGSAGRRFGNSLGILGLIFSGLESGLVHFSGTDGLLNSVVAGLGTGALYRAAAGPRSAAIAGAVGGLAAAAAVAGKQAVRRYVPI